jgi:very-short-patch-repair endonuclease
MPTRTEWQPSSELWQKLKPLARQMRREPTAAEAKLWQRLRNRQIRNAKFRRQFAIDRFIVDFCSPEVRLIIEVDGPIHDYSQQEDQIRQEFLESLGFTVLRFTNLDVLNHTQTVIEAIDHKILQQLAKPETPESPQPDKGTLIG